ncbi:MAG: alpha/beta hydrolase-fold protein [Acidobacteriota bacterium]|nr:alpha/beta hydrolase-fold protein [Acidobacteriota bacterium]
MFSRKEKSKNGVFTLQSKFLGGEIPFYAIFPGAYENSSSKFPVLYLLHGLFGRFDNWMTNTKIVEYAEECSFSKRQYGERIQ